MFSRVRSLLRAIVRRGEFERGMGEAGCPHGVPRASIHSSRSNRKSLRVAAR
jgi:hypothetical protein